MATGDSLTNAFRRGTVKSIGMPGIYHDLARFSRRGSCNLRPCPRRRRLAFSRARSARKATGTLAPGGDQHDHAIGHALAARGVVIAMLLIAAKYHDISRAESIVLAAHP